MNENNTAIKDARSLGLPKMLLLGLQHMFAMFGATILVPILVNTYFEGQGLSIQVTLMCAGLGTLFFHACSKFKVPGTGDVPLTVFQSLPLAGIIIVTSPQELVSMIVAKAVNMAKKMDIPILGLVENMSYLECPDCGKKISVFGESHIEETADEYEIPVLAKIPIDPSIASKVDEGLVEYVESPWLDAAADAVEKA